MLYYPWAKLNVGSELRCLLIIGGYRKTLEVGFSPRSPSISPETEGFEWRSCWTSWKTTTMSRTSGTTGKNKCNGVCCAGPVFIGWPKLTGITRLSHESNPAQKKELSLQRWPMSPVAIRVSLELHSWLAFFRRTDSHAILWDGSQWHISQQLLFLPAFCREVFAWFDIMVWIDPDLEEIPVKMTRHSAKKSVPGFIYV